MSWSKLWYILSLLSISALIFSFGYLVGNRVYESRTGVEVELVNSNKYEPNSLSEIEFFNIRSINAKDSLVDAGEFSFFINQNEVQVMIRLNNLPTTYKDAQDIQFPKRLQIKLAQRNNGDLDYEYYDVGIISIEDGKNGLFTTNIDMSESEFRRYERIVAFDQVGKSELPPSSLSDFASVLRSTPGPYFWSEIIR